MLIANTSNCEFFNLDTVTRFQVFVRLGGHASYHVTLSIDEGEEAIVCTCDVPDRSLLQTALDEAERIRWAMMGRLTKRQDAIVSDRVYDPETGKWRELKYRAELESPDRFLIMAQFDGHDLCLDALERAEVVGCDECVELESDGEDGDYGYAET